jgi:hypothetical protein
MLGGKMGPTERVRELDSIGLRSVRVINSREFRF